MRWLVALLLIAGIVLVAASRIELPRPRPSAGLVIDPLRVSTGLL